MQPQPEWNGGGCVQQIIRLHKRGFAFQLNLQTRSGSCWKVAGTPICWAVNRDTDEQHARVAIQSNVFDWNKTGGNLSSNWGGNKNERSRLTKQDSWVRFMLESTGDEDSVRLTVPTADMQWQKSGSLIHPLRFPGERNSFTSNGQQFHNSTSTFPKRD